MCILDESSETAKSADLDNILKSAAGGTLHSALDHSLAMCTKTNSRLASGIRGVKLWNERAANVLMVSATQTCSGFLNRFEEMQLLNISQAVQCLFWTEAGNVGVTSNWAHVYCYWGGK